MSYQAVMHATLLSGIQGTSIIPWERLLHGSTAQGVDEDIDIPETLLSTSGFYTCMLL